MLSEQQINSIFRGFLVVTLALTVALLDYMSPVSIGWGFLYLCPVVAAAYFFGWSGGLAIMPICLGSYHWIGLNKGLSSGIPFHPGNTWLEFCGMVAAAAFTAYLVRINDDLKEATHRLQANLRQKEIIFRSVRGGLLLINPQMLVIDVNPIGEALLGITLDDQRGRPLHMADIDPALQRFFHRLKDETSTVRERFEVTSPEKRSLDVTAALVPAVSGNGPPQGWTIAIQDLTELVRAHSVLLSKAHTLAVQDTRNRMARDLHDNLAQTLATIHMRVGLLREHSVATLEPKIRAQWDKLEEILVRILKEVRQDIWELRPTALEHMDFAAALRTYLEEMKTFDLTYTLEVDGVVHLDADREVLLFYVIQEALMNVQKHARAKHIDVALKVTEEEIQASIKDDGEGFNFSEKVSRPLRKSYGLTSMQERVGLMGGRIAIESRIGQGTQVTVVVPVKARNEVMEVV
ncbi:MAG: PAS domain-containing sensor histidine kinase [Candidatus Xenobia bacterium]